MSASSARQAAPCRPIGQPACTRTRPSCGPQSRLYDCGTDHAHSFRRRAACARIRSPSAGPDARFKPAQLYGNGLRARASQHWGQRAFLAPRRASESHQVQRHLVHFPHGVWYPECASRLGMNRERVEIRGVAASSFPATTAPSRYAPREAHRTASALSRPVRASSASAMATEICCTNLEAAAESVRLDWTTRASSDTGILG